MEMDEEDSPGSSSCSPTVATLFEASIEGDSKQVRRVLQDHPMLVNAVDASHFNRTPLMMAAREGHLDVVRLLVEGGADLDLVNTNGNTALYWACLTEAGVRTDVVKYLLDKGANATLRTVCGRNALMAASANGHLALVRLLLPHIPVDQADKYGQTALWRAARNGHAEVCRVLLGPEGKASWALRDQKGLTPLEIARDEGHAACVQVIESVMRNGNSLPTAAAAVANTQQQHAGR